MNSAKRLIVPRPVGRPEGQAQTALSSAGLPLDAASDVSEPKRSPVTGLWVHDPHEHGEIRPAPTNNSREDMLSVVGLTKSYRKGAIAVPVLRGVDMEVREGEFLAVVGQSGCGKSTLLHLLGTLDSPDQGEIYFHGNRIDNLPPAGRDVLRNRHFGMIFQFYHLLPELTTLENVLAPLWIAEGVYAYLRRRSEHRRRATLLLERVGLEHRLKHKPRELSGGEMQRAAIARALVAGPEVLLADEPTGNLDKTTGAGVMEILRSLNRDQNLTIVMVTHDLAVAHGADRAIRITEGRAQND